MEISDLEQEVREHRDVVADIQVENSNLNYIIEQETRANK